MTITPFPTGLYMRNIVQYHLDYLPIFCPFPFSFTIFLHDDNFNSNAPTFLNRSPTIFRALKRADGVRGG